ncbi:MAG: histidine phosphatase family protein [Patescibacteria group bacterium]|nr:histidine phosphatase family protein [Patescibacteria group bacterium]
MGKLVLVRHGQSPWNKKQIFTGWTDVSLTGQGIEEIQLLAKKLKDIQFDALFTSRLERARATLLMIAAEQQNTAIFIHQDKQYNTMFDDKHNVPVYSHRDLNERHYGLLQGMKKSYAREKFGEEQVHEWRRSYMVRPPQGESLHDVYDRVVPYFEENILPLLQEDKNILISAHGNSLRALIKYNDKISDEDIVHLELAPGDAISYIMEDGKLTKEKGEHEFTRPMEWQ